MQRVHLSAPKNFKQKKNIFVIAGGVAANKGIRKKLTEASEENNFKTIFPEINLCSDNAAMIAWATILKYSKINDINFKPNPRLHIS